MLMYQSILERIIMDKIYCSCIFPALFLIQTVNNFFCCSDQEYIRDIAEFSPRIVVYLRHMIGMHMVCYDVKAFG
jgi:hypothetical protein